MSCTNQKCEIIANSGSDNCELGELVFSQELCRNDQSYIHAFGEAYLWDDYSVWNDQHQILDNPILTIYRCPSKFGTQYLNPFVSNDDYWFVTTDNVAFGFN
jgi:hypothetical protein